MILYAVDDEPLQLRALARAISEASPGAQLHTFACAEELLRALEGGAQMPAAAFLDIEMPDMDGLELALRIKERAARVNIVFVTGFPGMRRRPTRCARAGMC